MTTNTSKRADIFVTVVAPVLGDARAMTDFTAEVTNILARNYTNYELVLIDSGAPAETIDGLQKTLKQLPCIRLVRLSRRVNRDTILFAGLESAIGDYVIAMTPSADPPQVITELVEIMRNGHDIVYGLSKAPFRRSWLASLGAHAFYWYGRRYLGLDIDPSATYLVGLNRRSVNALTRIKGQYRHVRHLTRQVGFKTRNYKYDPIKNADYTVNRSIVESIGLAQEIIVSYSRHPLRVVSLPGIIASGINLLYALYVITNYIVNRRIAEGWTTLSLELAVMFFILFMILSVVCEYVGRILEETRAQPPYHIMEELNSTVLVADETRRNITS